MSAKAKTKRVEVKPVCLRLPLRIISEANARGHWAAGARRAKEQRGVIKLALWMKAAEFRAMLAHGYSGERVRVLLVREGKRQLDGDNLQRACKAVRDSVAFVLGVDDADPAVVWDYAQESPKPYGLSIYLGLAAK
jgi:hypothetical protein